MTEERETLLEFPCHFSIKAFGAHEPTFQDTVLTLVRTHAPEVTAEDASSRDSSGGRYTAVTVRINAQSQAQLDAIYAELTADERVLMSL